MKTKIGAFKIARSPFYLLNFQNHFTSSFHVLSANILNSMNSIAVLLAVTATVWSQHSQNTEENDHGVYLTAPNAARKQECFGWKVSTLSERTVEILQI